jgi:hypothetical protein
MHDAVRLASTTFKERTRRDRLIFGIQKHRHCAVKWHSQEYTMSHPPTFAVAVTAVLALATIANICHAAQPRLLQSSVSFF